MAESSVFYELSKSLTDKERSDLLKKIKESLAIDEDGTENAFKKTLDDQERDLLIQREYKESTLFTRFRLWVRKKFSGKTKAEIFIQYKLNLLKKKINRKKGGLSGYETRDLTPKFADIIWELYTLTVPIREMYTSIWMNEPVLRNTILYLIEKDLENCKHELFELLPWEKLVQIYAEHVTKESLKKAILENLDAYMKDIPKDYFRGLDESLSPLYLLKDVILFPYLSLLQNFQANPGNLSPDKKPIFKKISAVVVLDLIEKLYFALYFAARIETTDKINRSFFSYVAHIEDKTEKKGPRTADNEGLELIELEAAEPDESEEQDIETVEDEIELEVTLKNINRLIAYCQETLRKIPIMEIIQYFRRDPYYRFMVYMPRVRLVEFYYSILKMKFLNKLDMVYNDIRREYVELEIGTLFKNKKMYAFQYYREYMTLDYESYGLPFFTHIKSLNLIYNYIKHYYIADINEIVQILNRVIIAHHRVTRERLNSIAAAIDDMDEKIRLFDASLSSDSEDGKLFQKLRFSIGQEPAHQRMFRSLVMQKDREGKEILDKIIEHFRNLASIFNEVMRTTNNNIKTQLRNHFLIKGRPQQLSTVLKDKIKHIEQFLNLLTQIVKFEKGSG